MRFTQQQIIVLLALGISLVADGFREAAANPAVYEPATDPGVGFNLIEWYNFPSGGEGVWEDSVQSMHDAGFREVSISPVRFVNINTGAILASSPKGPEMSHIEAAVVRAKSLGMRVTLNPFVEMYDDHGEIDPNNFEYFAPFNGCGWRGCLNFGEGTAQNTQFWNDYQAYLTDVALIGQAHGVDAMTVGTEYNEINKDSSHNAHWTNVINAVDAVYHGQLGYAASWDVYNHDNVRDSIWEHPAIDFLGIDSYFSYSHDPLTEYFQSQNPGIDPNAALQMAIDAASASGVYPNQSFIDLMTAAWTHKLEAEILPFAAARKGGVGMPVEFTEVGYLPYNLAAVDPQQQFLPPFLGNQGLDQAEQIMVFEGLIHALDGRKGVFPAMDIWQWAIPGSDGSQWNIDPTEPADQPNNIPLALWLKGYVATPEPSTVTLAALAIGGMFGLVRRRGFENDSMHCK